jgi:hypothetical protein
MSMRAWVAAAACALLPVVPALSWANLPEKFDPAEFAEPNQCPATLFTFAEGKCKPVAAEVRKLKGDACTAAGFVTAANGECSIPNEFKAPAPSCKAIAGRKATITGTDASARCSYENSVATSALGDYISDCFKVRAVPEGSGLVEGETYFVSGQRDADKDDKELSLLRGEISVLPLGCRSKKGPLLTARASQLIEGGASRYGYSYGFLTMPYKYFPKEKSFLVNAPIGAYLGWRAGQAGSGFTVAGALTLSSVKADVVDPKQLDANGNPPSPAQRTLQPCPPPSG